MAILLSCAICCLTACASAITAWAFIISSGGGIGGGGAGIIGMPGRGAGRHAGQGLRPEAGAGGGWRLLQARQAAAARWHGRHAGGHAHQRGLSLADRWPRPAPAIPANRPRPSRAGAARFLATVLRVLGVERGDALLDVLQGDVGDVEVVVEVVVVGGLLRVFGPLLAGAELLVVLHLAERLVPVRLGLLDHVGEGGDQVLAALVGLGRFARDDRLAWRRRAW